MLIAIWAEDLSGLIGKNNKLPWKNKNDLKHFKDTTINSTVILGRKTFESLGSKPLPNRRHIIMSKSNNNIDTDDIKYISSVDELLTNYPDIFDHDKKYFVIGGSKIYKLLLPFCQKIERTVIQNVYNGDTYQTKINYKKWKLTSKKVIMDKQSDDIIIYSYTRKNHF